jgi:hypothetical protein
LIHGGIGLCMGMPTFGAAMIFANMCFLSPKLIDSVMQSAARLLHRLFGWEIVPPLTEPAAKDNKRTKLVRVPA